MSEIVDLLKQSELFRGLPEEKIDQVLAIGQTKAFSAGEVVISEQDPSDNLFVIQNGTVEVLTLSMGTNIPGHSEPVPVVQLGRGQVVGEMGLVDRGTRSATVRAVGDDTALFIIPQDDFWELCETDHHIGYVVMCNIARELSFKLRIRNLAEIFRE